MENVFESSFVSVVGEINYHSGAYKYRDETMLILILFRSIFK